MFRWLRLRLALSHAVVLLVMLVVLGALVQFLLARSLDGGVTEQLQQQALAQAERIREHGGPIPPADVDVPSAAAVRVAVFRVPSGAPMAEPTEIPPWLHRYDSPVTDIEVAGEHVRVVSLPAVIGGRTVAWIAAGRSLLPEERLLQRVRLLFLLGGAVAVLASLGAGWWLAGRAVRPVERAYDAQAGFAADASHELRTPLAFIRSGVEVLAERDPELGADVLSEVDYLTAVSQRLLELARAERGELGTQPSEIEVAKVCRSAARRSETAHANRLTLQGEDALVATGDRVGFESALDAVLENVGRHGGGRAEIHWAGSGPEAIVCVADHGPGISEEHVHRAFERFFRADPSRARETGGAGLGLALARMLVEAQRGRMWVEPTPGGGLTAKIALPIR
jgi:two-component system, OmpR family, sensor histidine kinase CiaH